jgi:hypothetical protein
VSWRVYCHLYRFNKENDLEFVSTIVLLYRYLDRLKERIDNNSELRSEFILILRKMAILYGGVNMPVACDARVVASRKFARRIFLATATSMFQSGCTKPMAVWRLRAFDTVLPGREEWPLFAHSGRCRHPYLGRRTPLQPTIRSRPAQRAALSFFLSILPTPVSGSCATNSMRLGA